MRSDLAAQRTSTSPPKPPTGLRTRLCICPGSGGRADEAWRERVEVEEVTGDGGER
jgi:hypothetical protein